MNFLKTNAKTRSGIISSGIIFLMIVVFAFKSIIPAGFMPIVNKDGYTQIVICSGMGEKTITIPNDKNPNSNHDSDVNKICAYQVFASAKILINPNILNIPIPVFTTANHTHDESQNPKQYIYLSYTPRGPPSFLI